MQSCKINYINNFSLFFRENIFLISSYIKSGYTVIAKLLPLNTDVLLNKNLKIHAISILSFSYSHLILD